MDVVCGETFGSLKNKIQPYFGDSFTLCDNIQVPVEKPEEELAFLFLNGKDTLYMIRSPDVTFILVKLINFSEEERKRMKPYSEYVVYENGYLGACPEETVDMYELVNNTIDTFKLSFCKKYSIKEGSIKLIFRGEASDTKETKSKTLKEIGITNENKDNMICEWNGNDNENVIT
jgi:hypothetical protein